jgi:TolA-binding protein
LGSISHDAGEYAVSKQHMSSFFNAAKPYASELPEESNLNMCNYIQGYNNLKLKDYKAANTNFRAAIDGFKKSSTRDEKIRSAVLGDAILRAGDCHFKNKQYADALAMYDEAVRKRYEGFEYALFQKAIIRGLQGNNTDKTIALESLVNDYPNSRYTDEALFQLGDTYFELDKYDKAIQAFRRIVTDFKGKSSLYNQALLKLGLISVNQGSSRTAIDYYKQVFSGNPEPEECKQALDALREIYVKDLGDPEGYNRFVETVPTCGGMKPGQSSSGEATAFESAEYQYMQGRYDKAVELFTNYIGKYPNGSNLLNAYFLRGESYSALRQFEKALKDYTFVVGKGASKNYPKAAEKATLIAFNSTKDYGQAFELARKWEEAAVTEKSRLDAQLIALQAAYRTNNSVAVSEYANVINRSRQANQEHLAMANFYSGKMAYDKGDYTRAYPALQAVADNSTTALMAEAYHYMAQIKYRQRKYAETEDLITEANKASAGYDDWIARNLILLSDVYADQGDRISAEAALESIIENYTGDDKSIMDTARQKYDRLRGTKSNQNKGASDKGNKNLLDLDEGN